MKVNTSRRGKCPLKSAPGEVDVSIPPLSAMNSNKQSTTHTRHFGNLGPNDLDRYECAIKHSGFELSISPGAYDAQGHIWDASRY